MFKRTVFAIIGFCMLLTVSCVDEPEPIPVAGVSIIPTSLNLIEGESSDLKVSIFPKDADNQAVTWSSSDPGIASVVNGKVTALSSGSASIIVKSEDGEYTATCSVTVVPLTIDVSSIELSKTEISLYEEETETISATVLPENATDKTVSWFSSDASVAKVDDGLITAIAQGTAIITAEAGSFSATCSVIVEKRPIPVERIELSITDLLMDMGQSESLVVTVYPEDATNKTVTWSSDNPEVATVDSDGNITAISEGETFICASIGDVLSSCSVKVFPIEYITFEDAIFEDYCLENFDVNCDGKISISEAYSVTKIIVKEKNIVSLKGIEFFASLQILNCMENQLTSIDVSNNKELMQFACSSNQLTSIDVSNNTKLILFHCYSNQLTSIDVSNNAALEVLWCDDNLLTSLDVSNNSALKSLCFTKNLLKSIDLSNNTGLEFLACGNNLLTSIDVGCCDQLYHMTCGHNQLITLDVSNKPLLREFSCDYNQLKNLNASNNPVLPTVLCNDNHLTSLDVSNNINMLSLLCNNNQLGHIELGNTPKLNLLVCINNQLTCLDLSGNYELHTLLCTENRLTSLDVSNNQKLSSLDCSSNPLLTEIWLKKGQTIKEFEYDKDIAAIMYKD